MQDKTGASVVSENKEELKNDDDCIAETKEVLHINYSSIKIFLNNVDTLKDTESNLKEYWVVKLKHFNQENK